MLILKKFNKIMQESLITFKTAKLAKEKGFDWECRMVYKGCEEGLYIPKDKKYVYHKYWKFPYKYPTTRKNSVVSNAKIPRYTAPTQSLLQKWLREVHNIWVEITVWEHGINVICKRKEEDGELYSKWNCKKIYNTYEEALEVGLQEALKLIK